MNTTKSNPWLKSRRSVAGALLTSKNLVWLAACGLFLACGFSSEAQNQSDKRRQQQIEQARWYDQIQRENTAIHNGLVRERENKARLEQEAKQAEQKRQALLKQQADNERIRVDARAREIAQQGQERIAQARRDQEQARQQEQQRQQMELRRQEQQRFQIEQMRREQENARRYRR